MDKSWSEMELDMEKAFLAGVYETDRGTGSSREDEEEFYHSMDELYELAKACLMKPVGQLTQRMERINPALYFGPGKLDEIKLRAAELGADIVIFNDTLSPSQIKNVQKALDMPVMDRTGLILEIFDKRARSAEAKLQVELAKLSYLKPRLVGMTSALTRQGGTSGSMSSRGAGEKKLELDRRRIDHRLTELRRQLKQIAGERETQRKKRELSRLPLVSLVGYTNAGKSTIMNRMLELYGRDEDKKVFEADMLFATLDTSIRRIERKDKKDFLLSDTVGFINELPVGLVEAFNSTLEEAAKADLIVIVVDYADKYKYRHLKVTEDTLSKLGAGHIPYIIVYNKSDKCVPPIEYPRIFKGMRDLESNRPVDCIYISAVEEGSIERLAELIADKVYEDYVNAELLIPYDRGAVLNQLLIRAVGAETEYKETGTLVRARLHRADAEAFEEYDNRSANALTGR